MRVHDALCSLQGTCEVRTAIGFKLQGGGQQLVRRTGEIALYGGRGFMIEEDQAICVPSDPANLGIAIYSSLAGEPEAIEGREDTPKPVVCRGRDAVNPARIGKWLPILLAHRPRPARKCVKFTQMWGKRHCRPVYDENSMEPLD